MFETLKVPARWEHLRNLIALVRGNYYLHDVGAEVEYKSMEACAQTYRAGHAQQNPVGRKVDEVYDSDAMLKHRDRD